MRIPTPIRAKQNNFLWLELFHNLFHYLINGFLWNALAFVDRWDFYNCHREGIIQPLWNQNKNETAAPSSRPIHHFLFASYNFGNLLTTFAAVAGRSIFPP